RTDVNGAFHDNLCHIGNIDPALAAKGTYPMIYGGGADHLRGAGPSGRGSGTTFQKAHATPPAPRPCLSYYFGGRHTTTVRAGYGIYFVREDVGTTDQLSFQAPYLPIAFGALAPGCLDVLFSANAPASCLPAGATSNPNALPVAGKLDPTFIP